MKHLVIKNKLLAVTTFVSILLFELSVFFASSGMGWVNQVKNVLYLYLLYLVAKDTKKDCNPQPWYVKCYSLIVVCLVAVQLVLGMASNAFTLFLQIAVLLLFVRYSNLRFARYYLRSVVVVALLSSLPLVWYYAIYGFYARSLIVFDKSFQTFLFGVSYVYLFYLLTKDDIKHKVLLFVLLAYLILCNVFILQSKTSLFSFISIVVLWAILHPDRLKNVCVSYTKHIVVVAAALVLLPIQMEMPDEIKQAANMLTGREVYKLNVVMKEDTYEIREDVIKKTWTVLGESPLLGGGVGRMEQTLKSTGYGLNQGESQLVDFALEGGYTYFFAFFILIVPLLLQSARKVWKAKKQNQYEFVFLSLVCFLILCAGNEMLSIVTWAYIGILNCLLRLKENVDI